MQNPDELSPAQRELEEALGTLSPAPAGIDAVAAAFAAGQQSAHRQVRRWQSVAVLLLIAGAGAWLLPSRHASPAKPGGTGAMIVVVRAETAPVSPPPDQSLLMLQRTLWNEGFDGLPAPRLPATQVAHPNDTL